ncbi:MAG: 5'-AMP-activated protein kinase beta subunit family protein [archaeon]|nr:5'-AMP-activated protein kinase beta subunit family protein [archaeon]
MGISSSKQNPANDDLDADDFDDFHTVPPLSMHIAPSHRKPPTPAATHSPSRFSPIKSVATATSSTSPADSAPLSTSVPSVPSRSLSPSAAVGSRSPSPNKSGTEEILLPTMFTWSGGGNRVFVTGTWDNWKTRIALNKSTSDFSAIADIPPGIHQYKFIVDGHWKHATEQPSCFDGQGHPSNVLEIQAVLGSLDEDAAATAPSSDDRGARGESPPGEYGQFLPSDDLPASTTPLFDYSKPPPTLPPQLQKSVLNVTHFEEEPMMLPLPHHVMLNHLYLMRRDTRITQEQDMVILGLTTRYKSKFFSTVFYKPL